MKTNAIFQLLFLCLLAGFAAANAEASGKTYTFQGKATAHIQREARVPFAMNIKEVLVKVGNNVKYGTKLLSYELQPKDARTYHNQLSSQAISLAGERQQRAALAQEAQATRIALQRDRQLHEQGLAPEADVRRTSAVQTTLNARRAQLKIEQENRQIDYTLLLDELNSYFGSNLKHGDLLPKEFWLTAPMAGIVIDVASSVRPKGYVSANAAAVTIAVLNPIQVEIQVFESEAAKLHVGDSALVEVPSLGKKKFKGTVVAISWATQDKIVANPTFYHAILDVENADGEIRPGFKVMAHITIP